MNPPSSESSDLVELAFLETATPAAEQDNDANLLRHQLVTSPLLTYSALKYRRRDFPSRGLLGTSTGDRLYVNTNAPSSAVICGVQVGLRVSIDVLRFEPLPYCRGRAKAIPSLASLNVHLS
jgi:hypothetical protein